MERKMAHRQWKSLVQLLMIIVWTAYVTLLIKHRAYEAVSEVKVPASTVPDLSNVQTEKRALIQSNHTLEDDLVVIRTSPFRTLNKTLCSSATKLDFVVVVQSATWNLKKRKQLRRTWLNQSYRESNNRVIFLLGSTWSKNLQGAIDKEIRSFGDIVQVPFKEDYDNLTMKAVMGLRWISEYCHNAKYVVQIHDNVFVNIPKMTEHIFPLLGSQNRQILCQRETSGPKFRLETLKNKTKLWVPSCDYSKYKDLRPMTFCHGFAVFYSSALARDLFKVALSTPFYFYEDVFIYGFVASQVKGLTLKNTDKKFYDTEENTMEAIRDKKLVIVGTANSKYAVKTLWQKISNDK